MSIKTIARGLVAILLISNACLALPAVAVAGAAAWPLGAGAQTLLGYGAAWPSDASRTHKGVDLAADAGARVVAPCAGGVTFAGLVPGDGERVGAVTIALDDGTRVTLMPLESYRVSKGDRVDAGAPIGSLAARGDTSTDAAHLHVSLRRGETYLDPFTLLAAPAAPSGDRPSDAGAPSPSGAMDTASGTSGAGAISSAAPKATASVAGEVGVQLAEGVSLTEAAPAVGATQAEASEVSASSAHAAASVPAHAAPSGVQAPAVRPVEPVASSTDAWLPANAAERLVRAVQNAAWRLFGVTFLVLLGLATLWPLWRRASDDEPVGVTAGGDDVAAAVSR